MKWINNYIRKNLEWYQILWLFTLSVIHFNMPSIASVCTLFVSGGAINIKLKCWNSIFKY
jgi:hypothetical protein